MRYEDFWDNVDKTTSSTGCWLWKGKPSHGGYGVFCLDKKLGGRRAGAHRVAYELAKGPIPAGMCVCHSCDNRICVNPEHLFVGSHSDNAWDKVRKNRDHQTSKTHCKWGHEFTPENTIHTRKKTRGVLYDGRNCRQCQIDGKQKEQRKASNRDYMRRIAATPEYKERKRLYDAARYRKLKESST